MPFAHRTLVVYQKAISVVGTIAVLARKVHKIDPWLASQIRRAAASIVLNIAEGAGEYSKADKARFYRMARRSAFELSAALDVATHYAGIGNNEIAPLNSALDEVAAMLTTMTKNLTEINAQGITAAPRPRPRPRPRPQEQ